MEAIARLAHIWQSFTGRMIVSILGIHMILVPVLFYGLFLSIERNLQSDFIDQIRNNTFLYSALIKSAALDNDTHQLRKLLDELVLSSDIIFAEYIDSDSKKIIPILPVNSANLDFVEDYSFAANDDNIYFISLDIFHDNGDKYLGELRLGYDESPILSQITEAYRYGLIIALGYFLLSVSLAFLLGRKLVQPVTELRDISRKIAGGLHDVPINIHTSIAEIKYLANDFETMRDILVARNKDIANREKRLSAILNNAGDGIISINNRGLIKSFNKKAESIFGYTEKELLNRNIAVLMLDDHARKHDQYIQHHINTGENRIIGIGRRLSGKRKDGSPVPIYLNVSELKLDDELLFIGIIHDLSKEVLLESRLQQFWNAIQQSPVSIIITDITGKIEYVNPFFCKVTGYKELEVLGKNPSILRSGTTPVELYAELWDTINNGEIWKGILENKKKDGELFWESATICPVVNEENEITKFIAVKEDITERRNKDQILQQSMKMEVVGQMTNGISHDFNNLLTIITGNLQFLQEIIDNNDNINLKLTLLNDALSAANDGAKLIEHLMVFSGHKESELVPISASAMINKIEHMLTRILPSDIKLDLNVKEEKNDLIMTEPVRFESALLNLIINARDAMPKGGMLSITLDHIHLVKPQQVEKGIIDAGYYIKINITDTGSGISEENRERILEPFFTTKSNTAGTGLGLSMVYDFVSISDGGLKIDSTINQGTSISLLLPRYIQDDSTEDQLPQIDEIELNGGNETILLVEDKKQVRQFAHRTLEKLGYSVITSNNADEAMQYLKSDIKIDMLFTDIVMPGSMNGVELVEKVMEMEKDMKILLTTGMAKAGSNANIISTKFPILFKPYSISKLATYIREAFDTNNN